MTPTTKSFTICGSTYVLGGYAVLGSTGRMTPGGHVFNKTYTNLPSHNMIYFSFELWMIDSNGDLIQIKFDSVTFNGWDLNSFALPYRINMCGSTFSDFYIKISGTVSHSSSSLTLSFISTADQDTSNESMAIRDITLLIVTSSTSTQNSICGNAASPLYYQQCKCPDGQYFDGTACITCHPYCATCFGPTNNDCYKCKEGTSFDGVACFICSSYCATCNGPSANQCLTCKRGYSLFKNNICVSANACSSPFSLSNSDTVCNSPCNLDDYVYCDETCSATCPSPYKAETLSNVLKFCRFPCATSEYLNWDGSCKTTCPIPLKQKITNGKKFCNLPCDLAEYLYLDGTCSSNPCGSSYSENLLLGLVKTCIKNCAATDYVYWDDTCLPTCPSPPLKPSLDYGAKTCSLPCENGEFLYFNGSCLPKCEVPFVKKTLYSADLYEYPCLDTEYLYSNGTCSDKMCNSFYTLKTLSGKNYCNPACSSGKVLFIKKNACVDNCPAGYFENNATRLCEECKVEFCRSCPPDPERNCLECDEGTIMDTQDLCKKRDSMKIDYAKQLPKGHQYKLKLSPESCDLDRSIVKKHLTINDTNHTFPPYSFEVTKVNPNSYRVSLILEESILEAKIVEVNLLYLNGTMKIPKKLVPSSGVQALAKYGPTAQTALASMIGASFGGTLALGAIAALWSILSFQQFVGYFIFLNVEYPYQVNIFLSLFQSITWDALPNPLASITSKWSKEIMGNEDLFEKNLPQKFVDNDLDAFLSRMGVLLFLQI